ncbi:MAG: dihydropteroate synthase [Acidobacteriota bacterium]
MGVLNVTPDSFSDGGLAFAPDAAIARALQMEEDGADLIDIGAESTRPGAEALDAAEEWSRLQHVLRGLLGRLRVPVSVDTYKAEIARRAIDEGVAIVNDVSGLTYDPALGRVVAERGVPLILMHTRGRSRHMYQEAHYDDVVGDVARELLLAVGRAVGAGVPWDALLLDPGLGFAKLAKHSLTLTARTAQLAGLGRPLVVGPSRKSFLAAAVGPLPAEDRDWATAAAVTAAVLGGAAVVRVHRVKEMMQVVRVADALRDART